MFFDVLVFDERSLSNKVYRNGVKKKDAKKLVNELRSKGFKAQFVTCKGQHEETKIEIPENGVDEE